MATHSPYSNNYHSSLFTTSLLFVCGPVSWVLCVIKRADKKRQQAVVRQINDSVLEITPNPIISCQVTFVKLRQTKYTIAKGLVKKHTLVNSIRHMEGSYHQYAILIKSLNSVFQYDCELQITTIHLHDIRMQYFYSTMHKFQIPMPNFVTLIKTV